MESESSSFRVVTYNVGNPSGTPYSKGYSDHGSARVWKKGENEVEKLNVENKEKEIEIENVALSKILENQPDVLMLQEISSGNLEGRGLTAKLKQKNDYVISRIIGKDCCIAINKNRFEEIKDESPEWKKKGDVEYSAVTAIDKSTKEKVVFINLHVAGMNYDQVTEEDEAVGRDDIKKIMNDAKERFKDCKIQIVGGDFNAQPEVVNKVANNRFSLMKELNFKRKRSHHPTNVNPHEKTKERELDYQFVKLEPPSWSEKIKRFFLGGVVKHQAKYENLNPLGSFEKKEEYDPEVNPSDHIPLFVKYVTYVQPSLTQRIKNLFINLIRPSAK